MNDPRKNPILVTQKARVLEPLFLPPATAPSVSFTSLKTLSAIGTLISSFGLPCVSTPGMVPRRWELSQCYQRLPDPLSKSVVGQKYIQLCMLLLPADGISTYLLFPCPIYSTSFPPPNFVDHYASKTVNQHVACSNTFCFALIYNMTLRG